MTPEENQKRLRLKRKIESGRASRKEILEGIDLETQLRREHNAAARLERNSDTEGLDPMGVWHGRNE